MDTRDMTGGWCDLWGQHVVFFACSVDVNVQYVLAKFAMGTNINVSFAEIADIQSVLKKYIFHN